MERDLEHPEVGRSIQLIRWYSGPDGWTSEVRRGRCLGRDDHSWLLQVDGVERRFPRADWHRFLPEHDAQTSPQAGRAVIIDVPITARPVFEE